MKLSDKAWEKSSKIYQDITQHPFNQELMHGCLSQDKFSYYIEQDILYLQDFARCHAIIASRIPLPYVKTYLSYAESSFVSEQEMVHQFFKEKFDYKETGLVAPATLSYTSYILRICALEPVEVAVASLLPCFWVYYEIGLFIAKHANPKTPYMHWIKSYSSEDFANLVQEAIAIFNHLAEETTDTVREKMLNAFYKSTCLEWHFWNDAYNLYSYDGIINVSVKQAELIV